MWASRGFEGGSTNPTVPPPPLQPPSTTPERWYGTQYATDPIPAEWLAEFRNPPKVPELHLPAPNPFISSEFGLVEGDEDKEKPKLVLQEDGLDVWHVAHVAFDVPKTIAIFVLR